MDSHSLKFTALRLILFLCAISLGLGCFAELVALPTALVIFHRLMSTIFHPFAALFLAYGAIMMKPFKKPVNADAHDPDFSRNSIG